MSTWETPELTEIRMDAEIGSYQADDGGSGPDGRDVAATLRDETRSHALGRPSVGR
jgi:hypothetical protein